jgi:hypothetical protein
MTVFNANQSGQSLSASARHPERIVEILSAAKPTLPSSLVYTGSEAICYQS